MSTPSNFGFRDLLYIPLLVEQGRERGEAILPQLFTVCATTQRGYTCRLLQIEMDDEMK